MNVRHLMEISDDETFRSKLEDFFSENSSDLPIEDLCTRGGYPDVDVVEVSNLSRDNGKLSCSLSVEYTEVRDTSCADVSINNDESCTIQVEIDESGDVEFGDVDSEWDGEEYGEDADDFWISNG